MFLPLTKLLQQRAKNQPDHLAYIFLADGETDERPLTYGELDRQARAIAAQLQARHTSGSRALLLYPPGLDYVAAFFGCLYAGVIAVPAYPPRPRRPMPRIQAIVADSQPTVALTDAPIRSNIEQRLAELPDMDALDWIDTTGLDAALADRWQPVPVAPDDLAYLQYTSGSTATPKGVMVSHGNLDYTLADLDVGWNHTPESVMVTWLPPFHDMGLIYGILLPLCIGFRCVMMAPTAFIQKPVRWLQAIARYGGTHSAAPNFAYDLCVHRSTSEERSGLDLSTWRMSLNAAEPVRQATNQRFATTFSSCGFRARSISAGYGLAEATLKVTSVPAALDTSYLQVETAALEENRIVELIGVQDDGRTLTVCGAPGPKTRLCIVDPATLLPCQPDQVGEIWVAGPLVAKGYWNKPEETETIFHAHLADTGEGPFLRTGDLGFLRDGNLIVTGRIKDLIIVRGRNHYPQDIELTAESSHPALRPGSGAAFSIESGGEERAALVYELRREQRKTDPDDVIDAIRQAVTAEHELQLYAVTLTMPGQMPKTSSGKIQRQAARARFLAGEFDILGQWIEPDSAQAALSLHPDRDRRSPVEIAPFAVASPASSEFLAIRDWLVTRVAAQVKLPRSQIDIREPLDRVGLDSLAAVAITGELGDWLGRNLSPTLFYEFPTVEAMARHLAGETTISPLDDEPARAAPVSSPGGGQEPIAIIGLGVRFPGAASPAAYWRLLRDGVDAIRETPPDRWDSNAYYDPNPAAPGKMNTRWGGYLEQVDRFDADFFGISPREAARMDPQQRLLMEVAWEALEDAGQVPASLAGERVGVFVGISSFDYGQLQLADAALSDAYAGTGSALSIAANRLSYFFDWRGPSLAVDTACSSSLVAVHLACQNLRLGECDLALVGGVNLLLSPAMTVNFAKAGFMASDGRCKPFDARADGYVRSEGAGVVLLKPLAQALADGDPIYALVLGSATNQDGRSNGLTAPNPQAQIDVLRRAYRNAGISPAQVSYVETHGTGTSLGDPIEAQALGAVLAAGRPGDQPAAIGSVKSNIGHLEAAAGIAGLIKVALALRHGQLPPSLHFHEPNPLIPFDRLPLRVQQTLTGWPVEPSVAVAGVSAFGFGGANAHVVVQGPPAPTVRLDTTAERAQVIPLSAGSPPALRELALAYRDRLQSAATDRLSDIAYTAGARRSHHDHRLALVAESSPALGSMLESFLAGGKTPGLVSGPTVKTPSARIAFVFCGQGAQWWAMGRQLLLQEPVLRKTIELCDSALASYSEWRLMAELMAAEHESRLQETQIAQPALLALQLGLANLWRSWGIEPVAVVGHSVGEVSAAVLAGILSLSDALRIVYHRGRLMEAARGQGRMAAVELSPAQASLAVAGFEEYISIAAINSPSSVVLSGETTSLTRLVASLQQQGVYCRYLSVDYAFHSPQMTVLVDDLTRALAPIRPRAGSLPLASSVTGQLAVDQVAGGTPFDAAYWSRNMRDQVRFADAISTLLQAGCDTFLEIAPHPVLTPAIMQCLVHEGRDGVVLPSLRRDQDDRRMMLDSLATLYAAGEDVNWAAVADPQARLISLPTYPWQRQRFWLETSQPSTTNRAALIQPSSQPVKIVGAPASDGVSADLDGWLYEVEWQRQPASSIGTASTGVSGSPGTWLIFADASGVGMKLSRRLEALGDRCVLVWPGDHFASPERGRFLIDPARPEHAQQLVAAVNVIDPTEWRGVVHLWSLDISTLDDASSTVAEGQSLGCGSVLHLVQALAAVDQVAAPALWLVTRGAQPVAGGPAVQAAQSPLWGFGRTVALEHPQLWGGMIDLDPQPADDEIQRLAACLRLPVGKNQLAMRGAHIFVPSLAPSPRQGARLSFSGLRANSTYVITGGLGDIGLAVARWMIAQGATRLVLLQRTPLPPRPIWNGANQNGSQAMKQAAVAELEALGAVVATYPVDVSDYDQMAAVFAQISQTLPPVRGVIHAAGVSDLQALASMSLASLNEVLRPKVSGTWVLHQVTRGLDLDFFVLFSSISALLGSRHLAHYAAGNHFLDTFAHWRRARGLAAQSINWGPWSEIGMAARSEQAERWSRIGLASITPAQGVALLGRCLAIGAVQQVAAPVDWQLFSRFVEGPASYPLLAPIDADPAARQDVFRSDLPILELLETTARAGWPKVIGSYLRQQIARITRTEVERIALDQNVIDLGLDSIMVMEVVWAIQNDLNLSLFMREIFERPSLDLLSDYLAAELDRTRGARVAVRSMEAPARVTNLNGWVTPLAAAPHGKRVSATRNPAAVFLLSSPRSGSTLLRVMLAGHPALFCPPELHLLSFASMSERRQVLRASYLDEGLQRAWMELAGLSAAESRALIEDFSAQDLSTQEIYARLQRLAAGRLLVDKSPTYGLHLETLRRAEAIFTDAKYVHLIRHPYAAIDSFVRNRFDKLIDGNGSDPLALAEEVWTAVNRNVLTYLQQIDSDRRHLVRYEDLVSRPEEVMQGLCEFLHIPFDPAVLTPYAGARMTDGIYANSVAIGDPNFNKRQQIDSSLATSWRYIQLPRPLGSATRRLAGELNYALPNEQSWTSLVPLQTKGSKPPLFVVPPNASTVIDFVSLARHLGDDQPFYGFEPLGMDGKHQPQTRLEDMAAHYISELRTVQPTGPYLLAGRCLGGIIAFEMAQQLRSQGEQIALLAVLDTLVPPNTTLQVFRPPDVGKAASVGQTGRHQLYRMVYFLRRRLAAATLSFGTLWRARQSKLPPNLLSKQAQHVRETSEAHFQARLGYVPHVYPGRLTLFSNAQHTGGRQLRWADLTTTGVDIIVVPGNHRTMFQEPNVAVLAEQLAKRRDQALAALAERDRAGTAAGGGLPDFAIAPRHSPSVSNDSLHASADRGSVVRNAAVSDILVCLQPSGSRPPFFLVPDIDQTADSLAELAGLLGAEQPCYGLQAPGLEAGQTPWTSIEEMAAGFLGEMQRVQPAGPYALGGIGFGGIVAFEIAQQLQRAGAAVALLAVLDTMVPPNATLQYWHPPASVGADGPAPRWFVQRALGRLVYLVQRRQLRSSVPRRARAGMARRRRFGHRFSPATRRIQATLTAHFEARLRYQPQVYPGRITLFSNGVHTGAHQVKWALLTEVGMEIEIIPGDHRSIFRQPGIAELARRLALHLEKAQRGRQD